MLLSATLVLRLRGEHGLVYFKRLKSPTTWHRTIQFRVALSPQNSLGFQSLPDHHHAHRV